jgi:threonylcarbamoyladenosine tRNA methylthiotransferase MtaB
VSLVEICGLTWLHVFPYSERPGTPAAKMPQLPGNVRKDRAAELRMAGAAQVRRFLDAQIGETADVLVEKDSEGRSPHFANVRIEGAVDTGEIVATRIVARDNDTLIAHKAA